MLLRAVIVGLLTTVVVSAPAPGAAAAGEGISSAEASPGLQVAFPTTADFNPVHRAYTVTIDDDPELARTGELVADFKGLRTPLPHYGSVDIALPAGRASGQVAILRCSDGVCDGTGELSPVLHLADTHLVSASIGSGPWSSSAPLGLTFGLDPYAAPEQIDATWRVLAGTDADAPLVAQGEATLVGSSQVTVQLPADLPTGRYGLVIDVATNLDAYGPMTGSSRVLEIAVDNTGPQIAFDVSSAKLFPVRDDYLDNIAITMPDLNQGLRDVEIDIVGADGTASRIYAGAPLSRRETLNFRGVVKAPVSGPLPAGRYTLRLRGYDELGNRSEMSRPLTIDYREVIIRTWRTTITPASSVQSKTVGRCASLERGVAGRPAGTFGYYSRAGCPNLAQSVVGTLHRVTIPTSDTGRYGRGRLSILGGAAKGGAGSRVTTAFLQGGENTTGDTTHGSAWGTHRGTWGGAPMVYASRPRSRVVYWQAVTLGGDRYDVASFTIELELWDLT